MPIPAIVMAGDTRAAKAVRGQSKVFLEVDGLAMVCHIVITLQSVPEISEVWVVGNRERLDEVLAHPRVRAAQRKPLFIVDQFRNLMENAWETFRCVLSKDVSQGRDPVGDEIDQPVFYVSGDLPFATPQEISVFIQRSSATDYDYCVGLVPEAALEGFLPTADGRPGIEVAFFNMREGRLRQNNLHYARPARLGNRHRIEDMYEHRHQQELWNMFILAWKLFFSSAAGPTIVVFYCCMHLAGLADRWRLQGLADRLRRIVSVEMNERVISRILDTRQKFIVTEAGGSAIDVDTEEEYEVVLERFEEWRRAQTARAETLYGPLPLPEQAGQDGELFEDRDNLDPIQKEGRRSG